MVQSLASRSISFHWAPRTSPDLVAVKIRNSSAFSCGVSGSDEHPPGNPTEGLDDDVDVAIVVEVAEGGAAADVRCQHALARAGRASKAGE